MFKDKIKGCIYGQAIGDALGLGTEFMSGEDVKKYYPDGLRFYSQIVQDRHRRRFKIGTWTDDTDMMLCILSGIKSSSEIDVNIVAENFKGWANGRPMGIGTHTYEVLCMGDYLNAPFRAADIIWELSGRKSAANGGVMRTSATGILKKNVSEYAEKICKLTHPDPRCIDSCILISKIISNLIWNNIEYSYDELLKFNWYNQEIVQYIKAAKESDQIAELKLDDSRTMGYTYKTVSAALWALWHCPSFEEGLLAVVNAGGDADTNAAVACSILGAKYGFKAIPEFYITNLENHLKLDKVIDNLRWLY